MLTQKRLSNVHLIIIDFPLYYIPIISVELLLDPIVASLDLGADLWSKKAPELVTSNGPRPFKTGSWTAVGWEYTDGVNLDNMASAERVAAGIDAYIRDKKLLI